MFFFKIGIFYVFFGQPILSFEFFSVQVFGVDRFNDRSGSDNIATMIVEMKGLEELKSRYDKDTNFVEAWKASKEPWHGDQMPWISLSRKDFLSESIVGHSKRINKRKPHLRVAQW
jgi:hypothetical protein